MVGKHEVSRAIYEIPRNDPKVIYSQLSYYAQYIQHMVVFHESQKLILWSITNENGRK